MRSRAALVLALPIALTALAGCTGSSGLGGGQETARDQEITELKARVIELQRKSAMNEVEVARLRQQLADLEGRQGGRAVAPAPSTAPSASARTTPPSTRPAPPPSRDLVVTPIEESDIPLPAAGIQAKRVPPAAAGAPSSKPPIAPPAPPGSASAPAPSAANAEEAGETVSQAAQALYDRGYTLFHQGHYVDAEASFQRFLKAYPKTDLSDNAQYWIGECRYSRRDFKGALSAFRETVERYPEGNKVPDALLKAGQSLEAMGDKESARVTYREVIQRFPGSAAAAVAEERRAKIP